MRPTTVIAQLLESPAHRQAEVLRLTLKRVNQKVALGIRPTLHEQELLAECYIRLHSKPKLTVQHAPGDSAVTVKRSMRIGPVFEAIKAYGPMLKDAHSKTKARTKLVGVIDPLTAANWAKEVGAAPGTQEFAAFARKRIVHDNDFRKFKVGG
jgi:hypothetical protein